MKLRSVTALGLVLIASLCIVGASVISLLGSDPQPYESRSSTQCAKPVVRTNYGTDGNGSAKVFSITFTGDFSKCLGQQMLVTLFQGGNAYSYAVYNFTSSPPWVTLSFDSGQGYGDFKQKFPHVVSGRLVPYGPATPAQKEVPLKDIQVTFSSIWT